MPEKTEKTQTGFRLSAGAIRRLNALADHLELDRADVVDMALKHLKGSIDRGQGIWAGDPPPPAVTGGPKDAA